MIFAICIGVAFFGVAFFALGFIVGYGVCAERTIALRARPIRDLMALPHARCMCREEQEP